MNPSDKARRVIAEVHSLRMYGQPLNNLASNLADGCWDIADDIVERLESAGIIERQADMSEQCGPLYSVLVVVNLLLATVFLVMVATDCRICWYLQRLLFHREGMMTP